MTARDRVLGGVLCLFLALSFSGIAAAQDDDEEEPEGLFDAWADSVAESLAPRWGGPRVDWPPLRDRPEAAGVLRSVLHPVAVHPSAEVSPELAREALAAMELAHGWMERHQWPLPPPDGGYGGSGEFDLYIADGVAAPVVGERRSRWSWSSYDAPITYGPFDAVAPFAALDRGVAPTSVRACVVSTYVQAALLGADPAEANAWRIATGDYVAWLLTGTFGCDEEGVVRQQRESYRTWVGSEPYSGEGGALFLAMLSARTDGLTGDFIRDLWSGTSQLTWEGHRLRASPDLWQVIFTVMQVGHDPLDRLLEEIGVARYFAGRAERRAGAPIELLRAMPETAEVPVLGRVAFDDLPRRFEPHGLELEPYGSAYIEVDTEGAEAGSQLRVWLRGEFGVGWSLTAVRIGADGTERGRVRAPVRTTTPRGYIPLELTDESTAKVVLVVTNIGHRLVDPDEADDQTRSFRLIIDRGASAETE